MGGGGTKYIYIHGFIQGSFIGVIKGDTRRLDHSSSGEINSGATTLRVQSVNAAPRSDNQRLWTQLS